jgi:ELWxxDGT repeat protein
MQTPEIHIQALEERTLFSLAAGAPVLLGDLNQEISNAIAKPLMVANGKLIFWRRHSSAERDALWVTDGISQGSHRIISGFGFESPQLAYHDGSLYISPNDFDAHQLWRSDLDGTDPVPIDFNPGSRDDTGDSLQTLYVAADRVWFTWGIGSDRKLWTINPDDNTATQLIDPPEAAFGTLSMDGWIYKRALDSSGILRYNPATGETDRFGGGFNTVLPHSFAPFNGRIVYAGRHEQFNANVPVIYDPISRITTSLHAADAHSYGNYTQAGDTLYFSSFSPARLYKTDGTPDGTKTLYQAHEPGDGISQLTIAGSSLFFVHGFKLISIDSSGAVTTVHSWSHPSFAPKNLTAMGDRLYFTAANFTASHTLWVSDGTVTGTTAIKTIPVSGSLSSSGIFQVNGKLYLSVAGHLYSSDGTAEGTRPPIDLIAASDGSNPENLTAVGSKIFFTAIPGQSIHALYITDGTPAGTSALRTFPLDNKGRGITELVPYSTGVLFSAADSTGHRRIWFSDGTAAGTSGFQFGIILQQGTHLGFPFMVRNKLHFLTEGPTGGISLWKYRESTRAPELVKAIAPWNSHITVHKVISTTGRAFIVLMDSNNVRSLWATDGTPAGTVSIGNPSADPLVVGHQVYYRLHHDIYVSDGTIAGTTTFAHATFPDGIEVPETELATDGRRLFFTAEDGLVSNELWVTDGGTYHAIENFPDSPVAGPANPPGMLTSGDNAIAFSHFGPGNTGLYVASGNEVLKISDDAHRIEQLVRSVARVGSTYFSSGYDPEYGVELWEYSGGQGTRIGDLFPGQPRISNLRYLNNTLFFTARNGFSGGELYAMPLAPNAPPVISSGPYRVTSGRDLVLSASSTDAEGDAVSFEWDFNGDGAFDMTGQNLTVPWANLAALSGLSDPRILLRATDSLGRSQLIYSPLIITASITLARKILFISGTAGADVFSITVQKRNLVIRHNTTTSIFSTRTVKSVILNGLDGDDVLDVSGLPRSIGAHVLGGAGNDKLIGRQRLDRLDGGPGKNKLILKRR